LNLDTPLNPVSAVMEPNAPLPKHQRKSSPEDSQCPECPDSRNASPRYLSAEGNTSRKQVGELRVES
jgi:hypothetical protein